MLCTNHCHRPQLLEIGKLPVNRGFLASNLIDLFLECVKLVLKSLELGDTRLSCALCFLSSYQHRCINS